MLVEIFAVAFAFAFVASYRLLKRRTEVRPQSKTVADLPAWKLNINTDWRD